MAEVIGVATEIVRNVANELIRFATEPVGVFETIDALVVAIRRPIRDRLRRRLPRLLPRRPFPLR